MRRPWRQTANCSSGGAVIALTLLIQIEIVERWRIFELALGHLRQEVAYHGAEARSPCFQEVGGLPLLEKPEHLLVQSVGLQNGGTRGGMELFEAFPGRKG